MTSRKRSAAKKNTGERSGEKSTGKSARKGAGTKNTKKKGRAKKRRSPKPPPVPDPSDTPDAEVRFVQPYQATKSYLCPGCNRDIVEGLGHVVVVPPDAPDLRRHWHRGCWVNRQTRY